MQDGGSMKDLWNSLTPKGKKVAKIIGGLIVLGVILTMASCGVGHDGFEGLNK